MSALVLSEHGKPLLSFGLARVHVIPHGSLQVERVFSAHNLIKSKLRTDLSMEASAAQVRARSGHVLS